MKKVFVVLIVIFSLFKLDLMSQTLSAFLTNGGYAFKNSGDNYTVGYFANNLDKSHAIPQNATIDNITITVVVEDFISSKTTNSTELSSLSFLENSSIEIKLAASNPTLKITTKVFYHISNGNNAATYYISEKKISKTIDVTFYDLPKIKFSGADYTSGVIPSCSGENITLHADVDPAGNFQRNWSVQGSLSSSSSISGNPFIVKLLGTGNVSGIVKLKVTSGPLSKIVDVIIESKFPKRFSIIGDSYCNSKSRPYTYHYNASTYTEEVNWTVPQGWKILSGGGTGNSVQIIAEDGQSGIIKCTPKNLECNLVGLTEEIHINVSEVEFQPTSNWGSAFTNVAGYNENYPRLIGDFNGDGMDDIVGFGYNDVGVGISNGIGKFESSNWTKGFTYNEGYRTDKHPRLVGDFNGDGKDDIIGFGHSATYVGLSENNKFNVKNWISAYSYGAGWKVEKHPRLIGDFNGDGKDDVIGFGEHKTYVAISNNGNFTSSKWSDGFSYSAGYRIDHPRLVGDFNGDGKDDIVGFANSATYVGISNGVNTFMSNIWTTGFTYNGGYRAKSNPRLVGDFNGDGYDDIVGFGYHDIAVGLSNGVSKFEVENWYSITSKDFYKMNMDLDQVRVADYNGDGFDDLIVFRDKGVFVSLSNGVDGFHCPLSYPAFSNAMGYQGDQSNYFREVGNFSNVDELNCSTLNPRADILGFGVNYLGVMTTVNNSYNCGPIAQEFNLSTEPVEEKFSTATFNVYPNPTSESFSVDLSNYNTVGLELRILSISGKTVQKIQSPKVIEEFGEDLTSGVYFIEVIGNGKRSVQKVIKK